MPEIAADVRRPDGLLLITGPLQSGKSRQLWSLLRGEAPGRACLVRPQPGLPPDLVAQVQAWHGPGLMPQTVAWSALVDRLAALEGLPAALGGGAIRHVLRGWCAEGGLAGTPLAAAAAFRRTAAELAELCERCDDHGLGVADLELAIRAARARDDADLAGRLAAVVAARRHLATRAAGAGRLPSAGARLMALAAARPPLPWPVLAFDDFVAFTPAELALLAVLASARRVILTAVDDPRLAAGSPAARLRAAFPAAEEIRCVGHHEAAPHSAGSRTFLGAALEPDAQLDGAALDFYHERDPVHAGRAISAWLRRSGTAPGSAALFVRAVDGEVQAVVDSLRACGVPVTARTSLALGATAAGALLGEAGRLFHRPRWDRFLACATRLALLGLVPPAPLRVSELVGPWADLPPDQALEALAAKDLPGDWTWDDPVRGAWRLAAVAWLRARWAELPTEGEWSARLAVAVRAWHLGQGCGLVVAQLAELAALGAVGPAELEDLITAARVDVPSDDGPGSLVVHDAVRDRAAPRPVAIIHGLAHGRWPRRARPGSVLGQQHRAAVARDLARDLFDQEGQDAGELAAFLAVCARGLERVVLGIPCGEREPGAWLAAILGQAGRDLEHERTQAGAEAVPGAPTGHADSQGEHEWALWAPPRRAPTALRVPPRAPAALGLRASRLNQLGGDAFSAVLDHLRPAAPLTESPAIRRGLDLHRLLAGVVASPPPAWRSALAAAGRTYVEEASDPFDRVRRRALLRRLDHLLKREIGERGRPGNGWSPLPADGMAAGEVTVVARIPLPDGGHLDLTGRADRVDTLADGTRRVVDWKLGSNPRYRSAIADGTEGQLAAYAAGLSTPEHPVTAAWYATVGDGGAAPYADAAALAAALVRLGAAVARLAAGEATVDADGVSGERYAPIARTAEMALDASEAEEP